MVNICIDQTDIAKAKLNKNGTLRLSTVQSAISYNSKEHGAVLSHHSCHRTLQNSRTSYTKLQ